MRINGLPMPFKQLKAIVKPLTEAWKGRKRGRHTGKTFSLLLDWMQTFAGSQRAETLGESNRRGRKGSNQVG